MDTGPQELSIGTAKAFEEGYDYRYTKGTVGGKTVYCCSKGSENAMDGERLYIPEADADGYYVAYDGKVVKENLELRQAVFRTRENYWENGWHSWELNHAVNKENVKGTPPDWQGRMSAETRGA